MHEFLNDKNRRQIDAGILGTLTFNKRQEHCSCDGFFEFAETGNKIELSIDANTEELPSIARITCLNKFLYSYHNLKKKIYTHIYKSYEKTKYACPIDQVEKMYDLVSVTLKENDDFWVVLEPMDVSSIYNHYMRFTVRDGNIEWANIN